MYEFEFVKPKSLAEAVQALRAEDAQPLGGGQTLIITLKQRLAQAARLVDVTEVAEMRRIEVKGDAVSIGGAVRHAEVERSQEVKQRIPALAELASNIGDAQVRNRGTLGGSLANNDPSACYPAAALGLGATIHTTDRPIKADDYFQGLFTTALEEGELIVSVDFPVPERANYQKFDQPASRFALVGVFVARFGDGARVAVTGASNGGVFRWTEAERALSSNFSPDAVKDLKIAPDGMIGDLHGSPEYRAHLVSVLTRRAVAAAG